MSDLELDRPYGKGDKGKKVRLVQEWLCLNGIHVAVDGDFGPATESAVKQFQSKKRLPVTGEVCANTFAELVAPMKAALTPVAPGGRSLGELVVAYAAQHLKQHPREIGGQNRGPWVRLYMRGNEGTEWAWCAGFVCFCLKQACDSLGQKMPLVASFSCDSLAASAKQVGRFLKQPAAAARARIGPGSIFLNRRTATDWTHTGIVVRAEADVFQTIEGNTNDDGSREGYEVCAQTRAYKAKDFILL